MSFYTDTQLTLPLANSAQHRRTVRGPLADCSQCIFAVDNFSAEPLVDKSHERRTVRPLPADCRQYQISDNPEFCQISQFQLQFGIIAHKKTKNLKTCMETFQRLIRASFNKKSTINVVESCKLINDSKMPQKFRKLKPNMH